MPKKSTTKTQKQLVAENNALHARLEEAEETLRSIRMGEVDALFVEGPVGGHLFTFKGSDHAYRTLIEDMSEGALTITTEGVILYANRRFAGLLKSPLEKVIGSTIHTWIAPESHKNLVSLLRKDGDDKTSEQIELTASDGTPVPVNLSVSKILNNDMPDSFCLVATDLTEQKRIDAIAASEKLAQEMLASSNRSRHALLSLVEDQKQTEGKLRNAYDFLQSVQDAFSKHIAIMDNAGNIVQVNSAWRDFGAQNGLMQSDSCVGMNYLDVCDLATGLHSEEASLVAQMIRKVINDGKNDLWVEYPCHSPGEQRWFVVKITGFENNDKKWIVVAHENITAQKIAEEEIRRRVSELEVLYASSLAIGQLLQPHEIGQKIIEMLSESLHWRHATIRQYHPESETLELLAFHQPGLENEAERLAAEERIRTLVMRPGQGFAGWVIQHGQPVYCGDVTKDRRYIEVWPDIRSGMYVPLKVGERTIGCLSVESERGNAFTETDEWLITTLAAQTASALENVRVFEETRQRLADAEAVAKISIALRTAESLDNMLPAFLDETLMLLGTQAGAIWLYDQDSEELRHAVSRGWFNQLPKSAIKPGEGLAGTAFSTGNTLHSREFIRDVSALDAGLRQIPAGWGGVCVPIRSGQAVVGVILISVQLPRELSTGEIGVLNTLAEIVGIAIQRMRLHEQTEQQLHHVQALHEIDTVITASFDLSFTLGIFLQIVLTQLHVDAASILLLNRHTQILDYTAGKGFRMPGIEQMHLGISEGYAGRVALERRIIHSGDIPADNTSPVYIKLIDNEGFVSYYGVPLIVKGEVIGVLEIFHRTPLKPNAEWLDFLEALASQASIAIDSDLTYNNLQRSNMELEVTYDMTLQGWSRALDMRDKETEGHSERVTEMALQLAGVLAVGDEEMEHIRRGALLHDMGKIGIPDSILLKPGPLTAEEWEVMHTHPVRAYELLSPIPYLRPALEIPYCHHEKWDGSGYPRSLKGEEIPLAARIFAIVDVYDALMSDRPYRPAWTKEKAFDHIREQSGKQFDPKVVDAFFRLIANLK